MAGSTQISYQELIKQEYRKCIDSAEYFMRHYVKIQHPVRGTIPFDLFPFQEETLRAFQDYKFNIILKSRQMGISTLVAAYCLWLMIFNKDRNILIISLKQDDAKDVITKVRFANDNLPTWLRVKTMEDNRLSLKLANGSQVQGSSTTKKSGVGKALSLLIVDEAALIDDAEDLWSSAQPTLSTGGNAIILSTPRGIGNWFHRMWQGAEESNDGKVGKNGFHPITLPWYLHPERDSTWRAIEGERQGNPKKAAQEYDCNFLSSGETLVDLAIVEFYKKNIQKDPLEISGVDKGLWIWQYPDYTHTYLVSADVARGDGLDFSAAHVLDVSGTIVTQCAEYKGSLSTIDFGNFLVELATKYRDAILIVEREGYGWSTVQTIINREYKNLFYSSSDLKYVDVRRQLVNRYDTEEKKLVPGFSTNIKTRLPILNNLEHYFREKAIEVYSKRTLAELDTFVWKNGKPQAMDTYNDDLVMSLAIGLWIRDTALRLRQEGIALTRTSLDFFKMTKTESDTPIYRQKQAQIGRKSWEMNTGRQGFGKQNTEDLRWLIN
jgi:hypothetical protein